MKAMLLTMGWLVGWALVCGGAGCAAVRVGGDRPDGGLFPGGMDGRGWTGMDGDGLDGRGGGR